MQGIVANLVVYGYEDRFPEEKSSARKCLAGGVNGGNPVAKLHKESA